MQPFFQNIKQFLGRLSTGQQVGLGLVVVGAVALLMTIAHWSSQPDYALLFGNLEATDAAGVVEALREEEIAYELREGGAAVYVPRANVYELRMRFAAEGLVSEGQVGYELFDQNMLGMTEFMQELNLKRALEGELAQTIASIQQVETARVHLVMPERSPFRDEQIPPSASVVLKMAGATRLRPAQIRGITALVAGAVEGMAPAEVTILDTPGNMLSDPRAGDPNAMLTSTQLEVQRTVEEHLSKSGQSMLNQVLGPGNAIVRVSATLDFSRRVTEEQLIDPESATVISEERLLEEGGETGVTANSTVRNYALSRTTARSEESVGDVKRLTVSVILDHKKVTEGETVRYEPYTQGELDEIEALVKNAVGFNAARGDRLALHQMRFEPDAQTPMLTEVRQQQHDQQIQQYIRYGLIVLAFLAMAWLVRSLSRRLTRPVGEGGPAWLAPPTPRRQEAPAQAQALGGPSSSQEDPEDVVLIDDMYTSKLSAEAKARLKAKHQMYEELKDQADRNPEEAAELLRTWLHETPSP